MNEPGHGASRSAVSMSAEHTAYMTVLDGRDERLAVEVKGAFKRNLTLECRVAVAPGMAVKLEWRQRIILAEVVTSETPGLLTLHVRHSIETTDLTWIQALWQ